MMGALFMSKKSHTYTVHQATERVLMHTAIHFAPARAAAENRMLIFVVWGIALGAQVEECK
jgi:hypothetical protein